MTIQAAAANPEAIVTFGASGVAVITPVRRHRGIPNGVRVIGYTRADTADLVEVSTKHHWPLVICPKQITEEDIAQIFEVTKEML